MQGKTTMMMTMDDCDDDDDLLKDETVEDVDDADASPDADPESSPLTAKFISSSSPNEDEIFDDMDAPVEN